MTFLDLHRPGDPLLMPNPWDVGSARILASLGFQALATTSSGFAATLGRSDGEVTREEALGHAAAIATAVSVPVAADLENGFAHEPEQVADTVRRAKEAGLAGCSIEDFTGDEDDPLYAVDLATERVAAAVAAAGDDFAITARAECLLHGSDSADALTRLERYAGAGAHVLFAPGLHDRDGVRASVAIGPPVSVLALPKAPTVAELADLGVARISIGGAFAFAAYDALAVAGRELLEAGSYGFWDAALRGGTVADAAFADD